jgi:branched-chain amino acid transport system ATP-binding protein
MTTTAVPPSGQAAAVLPTDRAGSEPARLTASGLRVQFAGVVALDGVDLELTRGEVVGLIGPNGSGKTTCLNALSGFVSLAGGEVVLDGRPVTRWSPARRARAGLTRTFQAVRVFADLSVRDNVEAAALGGGLGRRAARRQAAEVLGRIGLDHLAELDAGAVSAGDERRVGIARALATRPRFLLLDEPAAGLNDAESIRLIDTIRALAGEFGCGVLLVEHDMRVVMGTCARLHVLDSGRTVAAGDPATVAADPDVVAAYFGSEAVSG